MYNLCIAAIADIFSVTINMYAANEQRCNALTVKPQNGSTLFEVNPFPALIKTK